MSRSVVDQVCFGTLSLPPISCSGFHYHCADFGSFRRARHSPAFSMRVSESLAPASVLRRGESGNRSLRRLEIFPRAGGAGSDKRRDRSRSSFARWTRAVRPRARGIDLPSHGNARPALPAAEKSTQHRQGWELKGQVIGTAPPSVTRISFNERQHPSVK